MLPKRKAHSMPCSMWSNGERRSQSAGTARWWPTSFLHLHRGRSLIRKKREPRWNASAHAPRRLGMASSIGKNGKRIATRVVDRKRLFRRRALGAAQFGHVVAAGEEGLDVAGCLAQALAVLDQRDAH